MKGQQQAVSALLITGILMGVVASVYFWGVPVIQKNQDRYTLEKAESFMNALGEKISQIANSGGRDKILIDVPGIVNFGNGKLMLTLETSGTIYVSDAWIALTRSGCDENLTGEWGKDDPEILCVKSTAGEKGYETTFVLAYRNLEQGVRSYKIELIGQSMTAGKGHNIVIEKSGVSEEGNLIKNVVNINIV